MNDDFISDISLLLGDRISFAEVVRSNYSKGEDIFDPVLPDAVVFPNSTEEVSSILKICNKYKIPVIPFGAGTSLEGQVVGIEKGITIFSKGGLPLCICHIGLENLSFSFCEGNFSIRERYSSTALGTTSE